MKTCKDCAWAGKWRGKKGYKIAACRRVAWGFCALILDGNRRDERVHLHIGQVAEDTPACPAIVMPAPGEMG